MKFKSKIFEVGYDWIDYNGHMNVMYYTKVYDEAIDQFLEKKLKIGPDYTKKRGHGPYAMQSQYLYLSELLKGQKFFIEIGLIDYDQKKIHLFLEMYDIKKNRLISTCETLLINVNLQLRKSTIYDEEVLKKISSISLNKKDLSPFLGKKIEIKKK